MDKNRISMLQGCMVGTMCLLAMFLPTTLAHAQSGPGYRLAKRVFIGGNGFWDYFAVEPDTGHIFIPRGKHVIILDSDGNKLAEVPGFREAHAITFAPELKTAYISDGDQATVLNTETNQIVRHVDLKGNGPDAILFDPATQRVFAFGEKGASVFDGRTGDKLGIIPLGGKPEFGQSDGSGFVYVNIQDKNEIARLDAKQMKVLNKWPIAPCQRPSGLAIDVEHQRLFASCGGNNTMVVVRYTDGKVLGSTPIAKGTDASAYDPGPQLAFASCGEEGIISIVHEDLPGVYQVAQQLKTEPGARTMALDRRSHNIYTVAAKMGPPPAPTASNPHPYPTIVPNTFVMLIYKR
jgi:DNA-binding beta-propeller fold protein YncE